MQPVRLQGEWFQGPRVEGYMQFLDTEAQEAPWNFDETHLFPIAPRMDICAKWPTVRERQRELDEWLEHPGFYLANEEDGLRACFPA